MQRVKVNGYYGLKDENGKYIVEPNKYYYIGEFKEGLAPVTISSEVGSDRWGYINERGMEVIKPIYIHVRQFKNGFAQVNLKGEWISIDKTGKTFEQLSDEKYNEILERQKQIMDDMLSESNKDKSQDMLELLNLSINVLGLERAKRKQIEEKILKLKREIMLEGSERNRLETKVNNHIKRSNKGLPAGSSIEYSFV